MKNEQISKRNPNNELTTILKSFFREFLGNVRKTKKEKKAKIWLSLTQEIVVWILLLNFVLYLFYIFHYMLAIYMALYLILVNIYFLSWTGRWLGRNRISLSLLTALIVFVPQNTSFLIKNYLMITKIEDFLSPSNLKLPNCYIQRENFNQSIFDQLTNASYWEFYVGCRGCGLTHAFKSLSKEYNGAAYYDFSGGNSFENFIKYIIENADRKSMILSLFTRIFAPPKLSFYDLKYLMIYYKNYFKRKYNHIPIFVFDSISSLKSEDNRSHKKPESDFFTLISFIEEGLAKKAYNVILIDNNIGMYEDAIELTYSYHYSRLKLFNEIKRDEAIKYHKCMFNEKQEEYKDTSIYNYVFDKIGGNYYFYQAFFDLRSSNPLMSPDDIINLIIELQAKTAFEKIGINFQFLRSREFERNLLSPRIISDTLKLIKNLILEKGRLKITDEISILIHEEIITKNVLIKYREMGQYYIDFQNYLFREYANREVGLYNPQQMNIFESTLEWYINKAKTDCICP